MRFERLSGWPAGRAGAPGGVLLEKEPKTKTDRIQHARHPFAKAKGGGSKTPTANHRRPLPLWNRLCGRTLRPHLPSHRTMCSAILVGSWHV
eukprot:2415087-Pyramimonas_sp.AAC.1